MREGGEVPDDRIGANGGPSDGGDSGQIRDALPEKLAGEHDSLGVQGRALAVEIDGGSGSEARMKSPFKRHFWAMRALSRSRSAAMGREFIRFRGTVTRLRRPI
jgi:hypothetical protein